MTKNIGPKKSVSSIEGELVKKGGDGWLKKKSKPKKGNKAGKQSKKLVTGEKPSDKSPQVKS